MKNFIIILLLCLSHRLSAYELGIATMFRNEANYLKEWIEYHHMAGVDHFLLYNDRSDDHWEEVLAPYIESNLVEVIPWHKDEITAVFPVWQTMAYQDALLRSKGNTEWLAFIDIDEFILPKNCATITDCLKKYFPHASALYICWKNFGTSGLTIPLGEPLITRLTSSSHPLHPRNASGKSIVKVDDVMIEQVWSPHHLVLKKTAQYYDGSGQPLLSNGADLIVNPSHTSNLIQINHYALRDEHFFHNVRLRKALSGEYGEVSLLLEHYDSFNKTKDTQIVDFIKTYHPQMYQSFWQGGL